jgi:hypothetical protein
VARLPESHHAFKIGAAVCVDNNTVVKIRMQKGTHPYVQVKFAEKADSKGVQVEIRADNCSQVVENKGSDLHWSAQADGNG